MTYIREPVTLHDPALAGVLRDLIAREPIFHRPESGTTRADFERMIADDYWEVGASGRSYDRTFVLDVLEQRHRMPHEDAWETSGFHCRALGADTYLLTYTLNQRGRKTRRMTLWQRVQDRWQAIYHQGTVVEGEAAA